MSEPGPHYYDGCPSLAEQIHHDHLHRNLLLVRNGVKSRAAGIRRCRDCTEPFIVATAACWFCGSCRGNHTQHCTICNAAYPIDEDPSGVCPLHREQLILPLDGAR
jgi:hypothetical protein